MSRYFIILGYCSLLFKVQNGTVVLKVLSWPYSSDVCLKLSVIWKDSGKISLNTSVMCIPPHFNRSSRIWKIWSLTLKKSKNILILRWHVIWNLTESWWSVSVFGPDNQILRQGSMSDLWNKRKRTSSWAAFFMLSAIVEQKE